MKRTATLLAGLLLVTGTVFAAEGLDFSGTVIKAQSILVNTNDSGNVNDDSNGDTDIVLKAKYNLDNNTTVTFKFDTDSEKDTYDDNMNIMVKTVQGKVEAQFDAGLKLNANTTESSSGIQFRENQDSSDTYIKYNHTKDMAVTFYPFNMGLSNGSNFDEGDSFTQIPGVVATFGKAYVGAGMDAITADDSVIAVKAGYETTVAGATLKAKYSGAFWDDEKLTPGSTVVGTAGRLGLVVHDVNVQATYKVGKALTLTGEVGMETLVKDLYTTADGEIIDSGFGLFVKGSYAMSSVMTPYVSFQHSTDGYLADGDMFDWNTALTETGGVSVLKAGADYKLTDKLVLNGEARLRNSGEKSVFTDKDGVADDSDFRISTSATFTF